MKENKMTETELEAILKENGGNRMNYCIYRKLLDKYSCEASSFYWEEREKFDYSTCIKAVLDDGDLSENIRFNIKRDLQNYGKVLANVVRKHQD